MSNLFCWQEILHLLQDTTMMGTTIIDAVLHLATAGIDTPRLEDALETDTTLLKIVDTIHHETDAIRIDSIVLKLHHTIDVEAQVALQNSAIDVFPMSHETNAGTMVISATITRIDTNESKFGRCCC